MTSGNRIVRGFLSTDAVRFAHHILRDLIGGTVVPPAISSWTGKMPAPLNGQGQVREGRHRICEKVYLVILHARGIPEPYDVVQCFEARATLRIRLHEPREE